MSAHPSRSKKRVCSRTEEPEGPARWVRLYLDRSVAKKLVSSMVYQVEPCGSGVERARLSKEVTTWARCCPAVALNTA